MTKGTTKGAKVPSPVTYLPRAYLDKKLQCTIKEEKRRIR
jgi:hypothetical protein